MIRKVTFILFLGFIVSIFSGCPGLFTEHVLIGDISIEGMDYPMDNGENVYNNYYPTEVFHNSISFLLYYEPEFYSSIDVINLGQECYATSIALIYDNQILDSTLDLRFSKPFIFNKDTIFANSNLFNISLVNREIELITNDYSEKVILFSDSFHNSTTFDTTEYTVSISCFTDDNRYLQDSVIVLFDFE